MGNMWVSGKNPIAVWVADLSQPSVDVSLLLQWMTCCLEAGEKCEVLKVLEAPLLNYRKNRDGALMTVIENHYLTTGQLDLFWFTDSGVRELNGGRYRGAAKMAYYDTEGQVRESDVDDLGQLLRDLGTPEEPDGFLFMKRYPPLDPLGVRINYRHPKQSEGVFRWGHPRVTFSIYSDIWLPWVNGMLSGNYDVNKRFDNRELARVHTPRLNAFLGTVRDKTIELGGSWLLDEDDTLSNVKYMVCADGIGVDAPCLYEINEPKG
jgi:hypothetical protein